MASNAAIAGALALLHELYPTREIGPNTAPAWALVFADWDDETLTACVKRAAATPGRTFFPTPGEIAAFRPVPMVDGPAILRRISALGTYNPNGWLYPRIETVRDAMGDAVASAYAAAGVERCFADDDSITQDIARRAFATELTSAQKANPTQPLLAASTTKQLVAGAA
jgi:hypothetical protein